MSYLHTKFHDNWISSFRGVAMTRFWDGRTDGVTALLDLLSPLATQVMIHNTLYTTDMATLSTLTPALGVMTFKI